MSNILERRISKKKKKVYILKKRVFGEIELQKENAIQAIGRITLRDLGNLTSIRKPPITLMKVMSSLVRMLELDIRKGKKNGKIDLTWKAIVKRLKGSSSFIRNLQKFDPMSVVELLGDDSKNVMKIFKDFPKRELVVRCSRVGTVFYDWIWCQLKFIKLNHLIEPTRRKIYELNTEIEFLEKHISQFKVDCWDRISFFTKELSLIEKDPSSKETSIFSRGILCLKLKNGKSLQTFKSFLL